MKISMITPFYKGNAYMPSYWRMILGNAETLSDSAARGNGEEADETEVLLVNDSPETEPDIGPLLESCPDAAVTAPDGSSSCTEEDSYDISKKIVIPEKKLTVFFLTNRSNVGIQKTRIHGIREAAGDWLILLDQDDLLRKDALQCFTKRVREDAGHREKRNRIYVANAVLEQENWKDLWYRKEDHKRLVGDKKTYLTVGTQIISPGQCLIPRQLIPDFWMEHPLTTNGADDYFLWMLLLEAGVEFRYLDEPLYVHRYTAKNLSKDTTATDASTYEFIDLIRKALLGGGWTDGSMKTPDSADSDGPVMPIGQGLTIDRRQTLKDLDVLEGMMRFKAEFRKAKGVKKLGAACQHPVLMMENLLYKIRTGTGYGFNR